MEWQRLPVAPLDVDDRHPVLTVSLVYMIASLRVHNLGRKRIGLSIFQRFEGAPTAVGNWIPKADSVKQSNLRTKEKPKLATAGHEDAECAGICSTAASRISNRSLRSTGSS
jgi:hypothetical protein